MLSKLQCFVQPNPTWYPGRVEKHKKNFFFFLHCSYAVLHYELKNLRKLLLAFCSEENNNFSEKSEESFLAIMEFVVFCCETLLFNFFLGVRFLVHGKLRCWILCNLAGFWEELQFWFWPVNDPLWEFIRVIFYYLD